MGIKTSGVHSKGPATATIRSGFEIVHEPRVCIPLWLVLQGSRLLHSNPCRHLMGAAGRKHERVVRGIGRFDA